MTYTVINVDNGYTRVVEGTDKVTNNFTFDELACKDGSDVILYSKRLMDVVQAIREVVGPLTLNSFFRTPSHNKKVGGVDNSMHMYGIAVDMKLPSGYTPVAFMNVVEKVAGTQCGIGIYNTFIHLDFGRSRRWDYR